jgi:DNA-binding transcriptional regulator YiaG
MTSKQQPQSNRGKFKQTDIAKLVAKKRGRPSKATPERIEAILDDLARGLTREQACACNNVNVTQFREWEKRDEFPDLRAKAQATRKLALLKMVEESKDWRSAAWLLERNFPEEFGGQQQPQIFAQQNNFQLSEEKCHEIDARVKMLREADSSSDWPPNEGVDCSFETLSNKQS